MEERTEMRRDLHELQNLRSIASRTYVKNLLDEKIIEFQNQLKSLEERNGDEQGDMPVLKQAKSDHAATNTLPLPTIKITNYAWDQSDKYVKLYLTIQGVHNIPTDRIEVSFTESALDVNVRDVSLKNYMLTIKGLLNVIDPGHSLFKQKTDLLLIMMKKKKEGENWKYLTKAEMQSKEKSTPKLDEKSDPQESLMNMMKQLYDEGDDDMKRTIRKAWHESQTKRNAGLENDL